MEALKQLGASRKVACGGDLFDVPLPNLEVGDEIVDLFLTMGFELHTIFGNHDLEASLSTAPRVVLGHLMRRTRAIQALPMLTANHPLEIYNNDTDGGVGEGFTAPGTDSKRPGNGAHFQIWGHHYRYGNYDERLETPIVGTTSRRVVISHSMLLRETPVFDGYRLFEDVETNADLVLVGHYHPMQPMTQLKNAYGTLIGGPGAMMRGALSRDDLTRKPSFALIEWDVKNDQLLVDFVPIEVAKPADEVFKLVEAQEEAKKNEALDAFRADLDNLKVQHLNVAGIIEELVKNEGIPDDIRGEALRRIGVTV